MSIKPSHLNEQVRLLVDKLPPLWLVHNAVEVLYYKHGRGLNQNFAVVLEMKKLMSDKIVLDPNRSSFGHIDQKDLDLI